MARPDRPIDFQVLNSMGNSGQGAMHVLGYPVVLNSASASPIVGLTHGAHALVGDSPDQLAARVVEPMRNSARARQLGNAATDLVRAISAGSTLLLRCIAGCSSSYSGRDRQTKGSGMSYGTKPAWAPGILSAA